jgi:lathosterol oxidase
MTRLLVEFLVIYAVILVFGYLAPAGSYYWRYHVRTSREKERLRIQPRVPSARHIAREIRMSLVSILVFALMGTVLYELYRAGWTSIYWEPQPYAPTYMIVSVFLCIVLHDTYFYWTHRFMHWRPVFKYLHAGHHKSLTPTPWAIFAFQPAEAAIQFFGIMLLVIFVPLHPLSLLAFLWLDSQMNTAGHTGFEVVPRFISRSAWYQGLNTVAHHDAHHTHPHKNFGSFFNVWDRWMGTFLDADVPHRGRAELKCTALTDPVTLPSAPSA